MHSLHVGGQSASSILNNAARNHETRHDHARAQAHQTDSTRNSIFNWGRAGLIPPISILFALVQQILQNITTTASQELATKAGDQPISGSQLVYVRDSNGFTYILDKGSMKIVHSIRHAKTK